MSAGYGVTLITAGDDAVPDDDTYHGARMLRVSSGEETNLLRRADQFGEFVRQHIQSANYAIAHTRGAWAGLPLAREKDRQGYKLLCEINGLPSVELRYHYPALRNSALIKKLRQREAETLAVADAIIVVSIVTKTYLCSEGVDAEKITVIPNGIDPVRFRPRDAIPTDAPTLLYIGTFADWQGLETLVRAVPLIRENQPVQLRLIGRSRKRQRKWLRKVCRKLGVEDCVRIEEAVPHDTIPEVIAQATLCVAPLAYNDRNVVQGCCPLKVLEYLACGKPIVASNLPVVRELARDEEHIALFEPDSPEDLAAKVLHLLGNPAQRDAMAARGAAHVHENYTWGSAQQKLLSVYEKLLV